METSETLARAKYWLNMYKYFCEYIKLHEYDLFMFCRTTTHRHHIKPKALYPEFKDDPNNIVEVPDFVHCALHKMLTKYVQLSGDEDLAMYARDTGLEKYITEHLDDKYDEFKMTDDQFNKIIQHLSRVISLRRCLSMYQSDSGCIYAPGYNKFQNKNIIIDRVILKKTGEVKYIVSKPEICYDRYNGTIYLHLKTDYKLGELSLDEIHKMQKAGAKVTYDQSCIPQSRLQYVIEFKPTRYQYKLILSSKRDEARGLTELRNYVDLYSKYKFAVEELQSLREDCIIHHQISVLDDCSTANVWMHYDEFIASIKAIFQRKEQDDDNAER